MLLIGAVAPLTLVSLAVLDGLLAWAIVQAGFQKWRQSRSFAERRLAVLKRRINRLLESTAEGDEAEQTMGGHEAARAARRARRSLRRSEFQQRLVFPLLFLFSLAGMLAGFTGAKHYTTPGTVLMAPLGVYWVVAALPIPVMIASAVLVLLRLERATRSVGKETEAEKRDGV